MSNIIKPTVGRKVWFRPNGGGQLQKPGISPPEFGYPVDLGGQPLDATVVYVWNDRMVNLLVVDHYGNQFIATSVMLVQPDVDHPVAGSYAEWMPYQQGQAKKAESVDKAILATTTFGSAAATLPACKGANCGATDGVSHSAECKAEHNAATNPNDFPLGKACDLSSEGACESCQ